MGINPYVYDCKRIKDSYFRDYARFDCHYDENNIKSAKEKISEWKSVCDRQFGKDKILFMTVGEYLFCYRLLSEREFARALTFEGIDRNEYVVRKTMLACCLAHRFAYQTYFSCSEIIAKSIFQFDAEEFMDEYFTVSNAFAHLVLLKSDQIYRNESYELSPYQNGKSLDEIDVIDDDILSVDSFSMLHQRGNEKFLVSTDSEDYRLYYEKMKEK